MNYIKKYEGFKEWFKKRYMIDPYLIKYTVTNSNDEKKMNSLQHDYVTFAESEEDALNKFKERWNKEASGIDPKPKLNITSVKYLGISSDTTPPTDRFTIGGFKNKIHLS